ncbi:MAG: AIR synthase related protein, partial [Chloroflexota bacterium]|nr:AIR synthase related protein [Chloroflexota bacterium]
AETLLELLGSANARSRKPVWQQYDHMNGTNTLVGPGSGDAALLRIKGTRGALALALDGPGRIGSLDPRLAGAAAVVEGALNVACVGATPIGVTNCLNFGSPEELVGYWQLSEATAGMGDACRTLGLAIVSGNVSLYNETPDGPILPTPVVGMVGLIEDRSTAVPMRWRDGDQIWLLGEQAWEPDALAASELAWRRGRSGGRPRLNVSAAADLVLLLNRLAAAGAVAGAHDLSVGGLGVALSRMAIASGCGARIELTGEAAAWPTAAIFGEQGGRVLVAVGDARVAQLSEAASRAGVGAERLGVAGGAALTISGPGPDVGLTLPALVEAWTRPF